MFFFSRICKILTHFLFLKYSAIIFFLNAKFISIKMIMNKAFSSFNSRMLNSSFSLTSRNKAFDTMCCLFDLCLIITLKRWIYSKAWISWRFDLSMKVITRLVYLTILKANSWSMTKMMNFFKKFDYMTKFLNDKDNVSYFQFDRLVILFDRFQLSTKKHNEKYIWSEEI
jgi:hypothetical protein